MGTTERWGLPWPEGNQSNDVEGDMKALAQAMEKALNSVWSFADTMLPWGIIYPLALTTVVPPNMLVLKGQTGLAQTAYVKLAAMLGVTSGTFAMPDMRGLTARGLTSETLGSIVGSDQFTLSTGNLPAHNHPLNLSLNGNHDHDPPPGYDYVVTSPTGEQHWITGLQQAAGGPGNTQVTFTRHQYMTDNSMSVSGSVGNTGSGTPVTFIPRSLLVNWVTRAL